MNYLISGASGLVGTALVKKLEQEGNCVFKLVRSGETSINNIYWNPAKEELNIPENISIDYVINLSGENIAEGRWTENKKMSVLNSRVLATRTLVKAINNLSIKPRAFFSSSAIGFYLPPESNATNDNTLLTENSQVGTGFLADVCKSWESEANKCKIRTINGRIGLVLSKQGGALKKMYLPFYLGLGGKLGSGEQYWSWISIDDLVNAIIFSLEKCSGPVNLVSTNPIKNYKFTKILGQVLKRPTIFSVPKFALKTVLGEMADELMLKSLPVVPEVLNKIGFKFNDVDLEITLKRMLS